MQDTFCQFYYRPPAEAENAKTLDKQSFRADFRHTVYNHAKYMLISPKPLKYNQWMAKAA